MSNTSRTILFFGTEDFSATSLTVLIENGFTIGAVITKPDSKKGRGQKLVPPAVKTIALEHNIPVWQPKKIGDIAGEIAAIENPIGVLVSFGKIIPQSIIDLFSPGIINVHPSLLPIYRGPSPIESAILNGDTETGVSIMQLSAEMDAGPVYGQASIALTGHETKPELYTTLSEIGANLLVSYLPSIIDGTVQPKEQDENSTSYSKLLKKEDGILNPQKDSAITIERMVRAFIGYPKTRIAFHGTELIVTSVHIAQEPDKTTIECTDGGLIAIDTLIAPSGKQMTTQAYLRGLRQ